MYFIILILGQEPYRNRSSRVAISFKVTLCPSETKLSSRDGLQIQIRRFQKVLLTIEEH